LRYDEESMWKKNILVLVVFLLVAFESSGGRPASVQVSDTLHGWTETVMIEQLESGEVQASVEFDDNGSGGTRRGGVCLVTDLGLGICDTKEECSDKAVQRGLPGTGTAGWFHYCVAAATDDGTPGRQQRCWSRPGTQPDYCNLGFNSPGAVRAKPHSPYGIAELDDDERDWTAIACLAGGSAPDGTTVGDPLGCATTRTGFYKYAVDTPIKVEAR
jgi:hypothetical protein